MIPIPLLRYFAFFLLVSIPSVGLANWPALPLRSGTYLPDKGTVAVAIDGGGIIVPQVNPNFEGRTGMLEGAMTWNLRFNSFMGAFAQHTLGRMWWDNVSLLMFGNELGVRFLTGKHMVFELAYLSHRVEYQWIDDNPFTVGGVFDHGIEVGMWLHFEPMKNRIKVEGHLLRRDFFEPTGNDNIHHYTDGQGVMGFGARVVLMPVNGHSLSMELEELGVFRSVTRTGVEKVTWNTLGKIFWRSNVTEKFGIQLGVRVSTNLLCGISPMLEIKRSMINHPMGAGIIGVFFLI